MADSALTLWYEFARNKTLVASQGLGPTLSIVRADATGTVFNSEGLVETVAANTARFDFNPANKTSLGLLVEELRINIGGFSEDTSDAAWVTTNMTKGSNAVVTPRGSASTTVRLTATSGNATLLQSLTSTSANRAYAAFIKRATGSGNIQLTVDNGVTWTTVIVTSDWVRLPITQAAVTNPQIGVRIVTSGDAIDFFGSDIQTGDFITSYIPNLAGSTTTRNADVVSTTDMSWYNSVEGTLYSKSSSAGGVSIGVEITDNSVSDRLGFQAANDDSKLSVVSGSAQVALLVVSGVFASRATVNQAGSYKLNDFEHFANGTRSGTGDQTGAVPVGITDLNVGSAFGDANYLNGPIDEIRYYNVHKGQTEGLQFLEDLSNELISEDDLNFSRNLARPLERTLATTMR